jgi:hypothetical protein
MGAMASRKRKATARATPGRAPDASLVDTAASISPTAVAVEALQAGVVPVAGARSPEVPGEADAILVGDPDDDFLSNEYVGDETPGASTPTPDQNSVDDIGRAYGLQEEDTGGLRSSSEVLARRDRHRFELIPPGRKNI